MGHKVRLASFAHIAVTVILLLSSFSQSPVEHWSLHPAWNAFNYFITGTMVLSCWRYGDRFVQQIGFILAVLYSTAPMFYKGTENSILVYAALHLGVMLFCASNLRIKLASFSAVMLLIAFAGQAGYISAAAWVVMNNFLTMCQCLALSTDGFTGAFGYLKDISNSTGRDRKTKNTGFHRINYVRKNGPLRVHR